MVVLERRMAGEKKHTNKYSLLGGESLAVVVVVLAGVLVSGGEVSGLSFSFLHFVNSSVEVKIDRLVRSSFLAEVSCICLHKKRWLGEAYVSIQRYEMGTCIWTG